MYEFVNMFFDLRNAAQTFQCFIEDVLEFCYAYIDDILVASSSPEEHYKYLKILGQLEEYGVVINPAKCVFSQEEIKFLGYIALGAGIRPLPNRVKYLNIKNQKQQDLRRYLGILNVYRKFLLNIAETLAPINSCGAMYEEKHQYCGHHKLKKRSKHREKVWSKPLFSRIRKSMQSSPCSRMRLIRV